MAGAVSAPETLTFSHPSGRIAVTLAPGRQVRVQRTARRIFEGVVFARQAHLPTPLPLAA
jgi:2-methylaconitate cis-trans-isomerase PrpF